MADDRDKTAPGSMLASAGAMIKDTIGPLAALEYGAWQFAKALAGSALNAQKMQAALSASAGAQALQKQLEGIGMAAGAARNKVEQIAKLSSSSAFSFSSLGQASKVLQSIGGSALNSNANLRKAMDAAAATGAPVQNVAASLGALYESLKRGGAGAGEAASQLASMGVISQDTAIQIERFASAGANSASSLKVLEKDISRTKGASAELAGTLEGLQAQLAGMENAQNIKIGKMFEEGAKAGARASIAFERIREAINDIGSGAFAPVVGGIQSIKEGIANLLSSSPVLETLKVAFATLSQVAVAVLGAMVGRLIFAGGQFAVWAYTTIKAIAGVSTAMQLMAVAGAKWTSWIGTAAGKTTILAAELTVLATRFYDLWKSIQAGPAELKLRLKEDQDLNAKETDALKTAIAPGSSADSKAVAQGQIAGMLSDTEDALAKSKERVSAAKKANDAYLPNKFGTFLGRGRKDEEGDFKPDRDPFLSVDGSAQKYSELKNARNEQRAIEQRLERQKSLQAIIDQSAEAAGPLNDFQKAALNTAKDGQGSRDMMVETNIKALRTQQKYAPNQDARMGFKKEADDLEDKITLRKRTDELSRSGYTNEHASLLASNEVKLSRVQSDIAEQGAPQMSDIARMGGSAGFAGVVGGPDGKQLDHIADFVRIIKETTAKGFEDVRAASAEAKRLTAEAAKK